jgi:hypothetical protein
VEVPFVDDFHMRLNYEFHYAKQVERKRLQLAPDSVARRYPKRGKLRSSMISGRSGRISQASGINPKACRISGPNYGLLPVPNFTYEFVLEASF